MNYNQFSNLSCYEEFEIQCALTGISKVDVLKEIGHKFDNYYFFISEDGIFNWFDLNGNYVEDPGILKEIKEDYISLPITKCIIPNSVTSIGFGAFSFCRSLTSITIPNNVTRIGDCAFSCCNSLTSITIPNSVKIIGDEAFSQCKSLISITIPDSVKIIDDEAFSFCRSLTTTTLDNVTSIGYEAFSFCESLKEVIFKKKTLAEVEQMKHYPFGIEDKSIIKCV
jgi:hypothetical protein